MSWSAIRRIGLPLALSVMAAGTALAQAPIKIGAFVSATGPAAFLGDPEQKTLEMYVERINSAGGVLGRKLQLFAYDSGGDAENLQEVKQVDSLVHGIPQNKLVLGNANAPVELIEYGDLQCPVCKSYSEEILPPIVEKQVKEGKAKIIFRNFLIIGEESLPAGAAAIAAGNQGQGWTFLELFYRNQGKENSGYVTDEFLEAVAKGAGVKDMAQFNQERASKAVEEEAERTTEQAATLGFEGTPSFAIKGPNSNGLELLGTPESAGQLEEEIEKVS